MSEQVPEAKGIRTDTAHIMMNEFMEDVALGKIKFWDPADWVAGDVRIWVPIGRGFYFPNWDWTDAPYRKQDERELSGTGLDEQAYNLKEVQI